MIKNTCLADGCNRKPHSRGLCAKHYKAAQRVVRSTKLTWQDIEESGLCAPQQEGGRPLSEFTKQVRDLANSLHPEPQTAPKKRSRS